ncbi:Maleylacetoacetate isomerase / Glutathione S-transferase, zeta [Rubellimicrobium mesophilum DSM 19309]|uniref:Maleylacetoacetate isomerase / Glutathione S-transferase, zeta n=1 Tax=Rubellimicrobium mesophilum DSM 19309 TaxID=442562 RepID=A0A017HM76_9RHOB|nr:maleylacetoacetate isomerase [Rubellimicrobium mesophilum]EYD74889.1 Maleylacetoacetate isomerase / Glutathione S-transferase, zeta [Rubellimicrobium mesophilum DSM 19309]
MIVLHDYWRSSSAYRVRIGLELLGLPYESRPVDLVKGEQRGAENLGRNPQGLVPVLEIDGRSLTQSLAILEYLDETRGAGFLPKDAPGRARVRALSYAVAMEIQPVCNLRVARHAAEASGGDIAQEAWMRHFIALGLEGLEGMLGDGGAGRFCHGDQVTLADLCLVPQLYNARRWGVELAPTPRVEAIEAALQAIPAVRAAHPDAARARHEAGRAGP